MALASVWHSLGFPEAAAGRDAPRTAPEVLGLAVHGRDTGRNNLKIG